MKNFANVGRVIRSDVHHGFVAGRNGIRVTRPTVLTNFGVIANRIGLGARYVAKLGGYFVRAAKASYRVVQAAAKRVAGAMRVAYTVVRTVFSKMKGFIIRFINVVKDPKHIPGKVADAYYKAKYKAKNNSRVKKFMDSKPVKAVRTAVAKVDDMFYGAADQIVTAKERYAPRGATPISKRARAKAAQRHTRSVIRTQNTLEAAAATLVGAGITVASVAADSRDSREEDI